MTDKPQVIFVNTVAVNGHANGVVNVAFATNDYLPALGEDGKAIVSADQTITANLRMDLYCAQQLHAAIGAILEKQTKPAVMPSEVN